MIIWKSVKWSENFVESTISWRDGWSKTDHLPFGTTVVRQPSECELNITNNHMNADKRPILQGKIYGGAHDHQVYGIYSATSDILDAISKVLVTKFRCTQPDPPNVGWNNIMSTQCRMNNIVLDLNWHPLSGFCISTDSDAGDDLVKEIGIYLNTIIDGKDFEKYVRDE